MLFLGYVLMGTVNATLSFMLTEECEIRRTETVYSQLPQADNEGPRDAPEPTIPQAALLEQPSRRSPMYARFWKNLTGRLSQISAPTLKIMYKLWFLLAVDSLADGMVPFSLTNYYLELKFDPTKSALGDINGIAYLLGAISIVFAGPMARKIGLINTMVFTHIPSSAAVLFFPLPPYFWMTVILLFIRAGLNNMDQAPRSAFIAAVVKSDERTAVMGITSVIRTLAATSGPTVTGLLAESQRFWIAFVAAGACRLLYDVGLYAMFVNMKLYQHEGRDEATAEAFELSSENSDEDDAVEMSRLQHSNGVKQDKAQDASLGVPASRSSTPNLMPVSDPRVRRRSPSPLARHTDAPNS